MSVKEFRKASIGHFGVDPKAASPGSWGCTKNAIGDGKVDFAQFSDELMKQAQLGHDCSSSSGTLSIVAAAAGGLCGGIAAVAAAAPTLARSATGGAQTPKTSLSLKQRRHHCP